MISFQRIFWKYNMLLSPGDPQQKLSENPMTASDRQEMLNVLYCAAVKSLVTDD